MDAKAEMMREEEGKTETPSIKPDKFKGSKWKTWAKQFTTYLSHVNGAQSKPIEAEEHLQASQPNPDFVEPKLAPPGGPNTAPACGRYATRDANVHFCPDTMHKPVATPRTDNTRCPRAARTGPLHQLPTVVPPPPPIRQPLSLVSI